MVLFCVERNREILLYPCPTQKNWVAFDGVMSDTLISSRSFQWSMFVRSSGFVITSISVLLRCCFFHPAAASAHDIQFPHSRAALQAPSTASSMILKRNPRDRFSSQSTLSWNVRDGTAGTPTGKVRWIPVTRSSLFWFWCAEKACLQSKFIPTFSKCIRPVDIQRPLETIESSLTLQFCIRNIAIGTRLRERCWFIDSINCMQIHRRFPVPSPKQYRKIEFLRFLLHRHNQ